MTIGYRICRKISGWLFLGADIFLLIANFYSMDVAHLIAAILFISCAIAISLSAKNHRYLFYNGIAVIIAYILVSSTGSGEGDTAKYIGGIIGVIGGALIIRSAFQREFNKQYKLSFPFNLLDEYPLASAGTIEGASALFIALGAFLSHQYILAFVAATWLLGHIFLIFSDEYFRTKFKRCDD